VLRNSIILFFKKPKKIKKPGMVTHVYNPSYSKAEITRIAAEVQSKQKLARRDLNQQATHL
jgi:hypothetical protein